VSPKSVVPQVDWTQFVRLASRAKSFDHLAGELAHLAKHSCGADEADILFLHDEELRLCASTMYPEYVGRLRVNPRLGLTGKAMQSGTTVVVKKDLCKHPSFQQFTGYDEQGFQSGVFLPLVNESDQSGVLILRREKAWTPSADELALFSAIGNAVSGLLHAYHAAFQAGSAASRRIGAVSQVAENINRSPYLEEILQLLVSLTAQQFQYKVCTVRLLDESNQELVLRATQARSKGYQRKRAIKLGESIAGRVIVEQNSIIINDVQAEEDYIGHDLAVEQGLRSMICVPLLVQDRAVGVITCYTDIVREFEADEVQALETIAKQAAVTIEHAKLQVRHTLMQEMHHRVKNNLQQVVSLLRLQLRHRHYTSIEHAITDSLNRIVAIASVHDLLSREDLDHVGLKSIAETLVHHQQQSFISPDKRIQFDVRGDEVRLNMTQANQIALVLNELISNAVEHGFHVSNQGEMHVNIEDLDDRVGVWVSNNGDPVAEDFDLSEDGHLGLQIVSNLARALGGQFKLENRLGWTVAEVIFTRQTSE